MRSFRRAKSTVTARRSKRAGPVENHKTGLPLEPYPCMRAHQNPPSPKSPRDGPVAHAPPDKAFGHYLLPFIQRLHLQLGQ